MEVLKVDLEQDEVFVFTPKGDVVTLPAGATAVDFAYTVHTEGRAPLHRRPVNGRLVPLDSALASGDSVEIFTSRWRGGPSRDWLRFVQTPRARSKIASGSREAPDDAIETGREELVKGAPEGGPAVQKLAGSSILAKVAVAMNYGRPRGASTPPSARATCRPRRWPSGSSGRCGAARSRSPPPPPGPAGRTRGNSKIGVHVEGLDDVLVRHCPGAHPVPGDEIIGFVTRGRVCLSTGPTAPTPPVLTSQSSGSSRWSGTGSPRGAGSSRSRSRLSTARSCCATWPGAGRPPRRHHLLRHPYHRRPGGTLHFDFEVSDPGHLDSILAACAGRLHL